MANKCLLKSFLCHFSCWITRIANSYRGRIAFETFCFSKGNIGGNPKAKRTPPQKGRSKRLFYPPPCRVPWHYGVSCNNRREMHKTILMPKHKMPLSILSPCVSVREYRGSARRARGLNTIVEQKYETPPPAVFRSITGAFRVI